MSLKEVLRTKNLIPCIYPTLKCLVTVGEARPKDEYLLLSPDSSLLFLMRLETFRERDLRRRSGSIWEGHTAGSLGRDAHLLAKLQNQ